MIARYGSYADLDAVLGSEDSSINIGGAYDSNSGKPIDVKLPKLDATTKNQAVSVPEGGTVLLGGVKPRRMAENESFGVRQGDGQQGQQGQQQGQPGQQGQQGNNRVSQSKAKVSSRGNRVKKVSNRVSRGNRVSRVSSNCLLYTSPSPRD